MRLRREIICSILITLFVAIPTVPVLADSNESLESEKYYMTGDVSYESPITVVIKEDVMFQNVNETEEEYAFEKDLLDTNPMELFEENSKIIAATIKNQTKRTVEIGQGEYELIHQFADIYLNSYITKKMPDIGAYYDLSNYICKQNSISIETFAYKNAVTKSNCVKSFDRTVHIAEVIPVAGQVNEILFYLEQTLHTDNGDERGGIWFLVQIANTKEGYKFLNIWIQSPGFEMVQNYLISNYLSKGIELKRAMVERDILDEYDANKESNRIKKPVESHDEPDDKVGKI